MTMGRWSEESESSPTSLPTPSAISAETKVKWMAVLLWSDRSGILVNDPSFNTMKLLSLIWPVMVGLEDSKPFSQLLSLWNHPWPSTCYHTPPRLAHFNGCVAINHSEVSSAFHPDPDGSSVGRARSLGYFTGLDIGFDVNFMQTVSCPSGWLGRSMAGSNTLRVWASHPVDSAVTAETRFRSWPERYVVSAELRYGWWNTA